MSVVNVKELGNDSNSIIIALSNSPPLCRAHLLRRPLLEPVVVALLGVLSLHRFREP